MEKYGFVYIWRDRKTKRYYIGSHWGTIEDGYICSSRWMRKSFNRRPDDFKRRILQVVQHRQQLLVEEQRWLSMIRPNEVKIRYYNICLHVNAPWWNEENSRKTVGQKISESHTGKKHGPRDPSVGRKISKALKAKGIKPPCLPKTPPMLGKKHTEETKRKMSKSAKGRLISEEVKQKIGESLKGRDSWCTGKTWDDMYGPEKAEKMRKERRLKMLGKKRGPHSEETKRKISEGNRKEAK